MFFGHLSGFEVKYRRRVRCFQPILAFLDRTLINSNKMAAQTGQTIHLPVGILPTIHIKKSELAANNFVKKA